MGNKRKIGIVLEVDDKGTAKLIKFSESAEKSFKKTSTSAEGFTKKLAALSGVFAGLVTLAGALSLARFVRENLEAADAIGKVADKVGFTTDQLQELRFAAEQSGVSAGTLDMALQRFSRRLGEVAMGTGELKKTAEQYNIKLTDSEGRMRSNMEIMQDWAEVIKNAASEQEALRISQKLYDSEGASLVNLLRHGADGMNRLRQEAHDLGIVLDEELIRGAEKANDEINKLSNVLRAQFMGAIAELAPEIAQLGVTITDAFRDESAVDFGQAIVTVAEGVVTSIKAVGTAIATLNEFALRVRTLWDPEAENLFQAQQWVLANTHLKKVNKTLSALEDKLNKARNGFQVITPGAKKAAKELEKAIERLYEQIQQQDEDAFDTQIRHLDELAEKWREHEDMIVLIQHRKWQLIYSAIDKYTAEVLEAFEEERAAAEKLGRAEIARRDKTGKEIVKVNKSNLQKMLEDWADTSKGWEDIAVDALRGIQQTLYDSFRKAFEGVGNLWDNLWGGMKNIAYQVLAAIATRMATGLVANIVLNIAPSLSGILAGAAGGKGGGGLNLLNFGGAGGGGLGGWLTKTLGTGAVGAAGPQIPTLWGVNAAGWNAALGAAGLGALGGGLIAPWIFGGKGYSTMGASLGGGLGAGAASLMATAGLLPISGPLAPILGGVLGGLGGGFLGSMFGGNDDSAEREADARKFRELAEKIAGREGSQADYMEAIKYGHRSDNRVGGQAMDKLYAMARQQGLLDWWAPTPGQLGDESRRGYTDEQWKRFQVYGGAEAGQTGAMDFAQLFGGGGQGAWGGADWSQVQDAMEGLSDETIERLGSSLGTIKNLATEWGLSVADLLGPLNDADLNSDQWKTALEELSAATLVQNAADAERAKGLSELEVVQNKVMRSIQLMAGWNDMDAEGKSDLIDLIREDAGRREELMNAAKRLKEVEDLLTGSHKMSKEEVEKLAQEYADLTEMLGLNDTAAADAASEAEKFAKVMREEVIPALREALGLTDPDEKKHHHGGLVYHRGGMVGAMLRAGMITPHGGAAYMHTGGLRPDERMAILQAGEFVIRRSSVNPETLAALRSINATGRLPYEMFSRAMERLNDPTRFHTGGPVAPMPASAPAPQPQSGGNVTINIAPGAITIVTQPGQDAGEITREVKAELLALTKTPQGQAQLREAVDKAPERNFV